MLDTNQREQHQMALPPGFQFDEYRLENVLGKGGFGITYLASDNHLGTKVAIKELLPDGIATRVQTTTVVPQTLSQQDNFEWAQQRFIEEARALAKLSHPNIVRVLRLFRANGTAYMVMEYIEGQSLEDWMKHQSGPPSESELRRHVSGVLDGLEYIHKQSLYHRDIKPDNIFLRSQGDPVLIDFGSARADLGKTMMMTSVVTHGYSPFEQYQTSSRQGPYSDFYSLAAVLFRAVTGKKPPSAIDRISDDSQLRPLLDRARGAYSEVLLAAIEQGMSLKIEQRPQSAAEFRQLLADGVVKPASSPPTQISREPAGPPSMRMGPASMQIPTSPEPASAAMAGVAPGKLLAICGLLGFVMSSLWIVSFFHPAAAGGTSAAANLLDAAAAFLLPFCAVWPLVAVTGRKLGTGNLYLLSLAGAAGGILLLALSAVAMVFLSGASYQEWGARAFRLLLIPEWMFLWSAWIARRGIQGDDLKAAPGKALGSVLMTAGGSALACLLQLAARSSGVAHAEVFAALGLSFIACLLAAVLGLNVPRGVAHRQVISVRGFREQSGVPYWGAALIALLVILMGHQTGDLAGLAAPGAGIVIADSMWLLRVFCWMAGMAAVVLVLPRSGVRLGLTGLAVASVLVAFLPSFLGYASDGDPQSSFSGWITPLFEGLLQGGFLGCLALMTIEPPPQFRMAGGMFSFILCGAVGGVLSVALALFFDPRLARLGYVPRALFGGHAELWHASTWTAMAIIQAALALLLAAIVQIAVSSSATAKR